MERVGGHKERPEARPGRSYRFLETGRGESEHTQPAGPHAQIPTGRVARAAPQIGSRVPQPPSAQQGEASSRRGKRALSWGTPGCPTGPGVRFQEHSITCLGQSPGEGAVYPLRPYPVPFTGCPPKNYLVS